MNLPFSTLLALRQLRHLGRGLVGAFAGVCVAIVLVFVQFGFQKALLDSVLNFGQALDADLVITSPAFESLAYPPPPWFPRPVIERAKGVPGVTQVTPLWVTTAQVRPAEHGEPVAVRIIAHEPDRHPFLLDIAPDAAARLALPGTAHIDRRSRERLGELAAAAARGTPTTLYLQAAASPLAPRIDIVGTFSMGPDFTMPGYIVMSDLNYYRMLRMPLDRVSLAAVKVAPDVPLANVARALQDAAGHDARVQPRASFIAAEREYFLNRTPIGLIFSFGIGIGIFIGVVFVLEVLRGIIDSNVSEYAVLNAMGYSHGFFAAIVLQIAGTVAVLAFVPSLGITILLYHLIGSITELRFALTPALSASVFGATLLMSALAVLLALRKLRRNSPIDLFA